MAEYFHIWILERDPEKTTLKFDLSQADLLEKVVNRYHRGETFILSGSKVDPAKVEQIMITTSSVPSTYLIERTREMHNKQRVFGNESLARISALKSATEVTDDYITHVPEVHSSKPSTLNPDSERVFVVHGKDVKAKSSLFVFLRSIGLSPIEWGEAKHATGKGSPYIGEILDAGFKMAQAALILLTPDEKVSLRRELSGSDLNPEERQARPNVYIELGMALGMKPDQTVIVEMGDLRPASDILGRHVVRLDNTPSTRNQLISALVTAGCKVNTTHKDDWLNSGDLSPTPEATYD